MTRASTTGLRRGLAFLAACAVLVGPGAVGASRADAAGEAIYLRGILPSGRPLHGDRPQGLVLEGRSAACVNCHRRSGLGMQEGRESIPPIAGRYLFYPRARPGDALDLPFVEGMRADRDPYTPATLARAIREGVGADGKPLDVLMPRYAMDDAAIENLIAYLRTLAPEEVPGVTDSVLHFATIVTPDADPAVRTGVLDVLQKFFDDKNHYTRAESPRLRSPRRLRFKVNRYWALHVWQLEGAADTWEKQLRAKLAAQPVFAVISGVGGSTWGPVHRFCEKEALPCLFPDVDLPVDSEGDSHDVYFSKGVLLEASLIAEDLRENAMRSGIRRVVQIYRGGDVGSGAANALASALAQASPAGRIRVVNRSLSGAPGDHAIDAALRELRGGDAVILWLRRPDVASLGSPPAGVARAYLSGRMGGLEEAPLSAAWRRITHLAYPFNLPDRRRVQVDYALGWFRIRHVPVVSLQAQADAYLACIILSDTINHLVDTFQRDYLIERIEDGLEHRILTGYYPRLALAAGQAFASKGGYIVHFADPAGLRVIAEGRWIAP